MKILVECDIARLRLSFVMLHSHYHVNIYSWRMIVKTDEIAVT